MRRRTALAAAVLAATAGVPAVAQSGPIDPDASITDGSAQAALDKAKATWRQRGYKSYTEEVKLSCFCRQPLTYHRVEVRRGTLRPGAAKEVTAAATVPRQFGLIQRAIDDGVSGLDVSYGDRGQPRHIALDPDARIADEESTYDMRHLKRP